MVGAPEVRISESDGAGGLRDPEWVIAFNPYESGSPRHEYFVEARLPTDEPAETHGGSESLDACHGVQTAIPGAIGTIGTIDVGLSRVGETRQYSSYRSAASRPLVFIKTTIAPESTLPTLPPGRVYSQVPQAGFVKPFAYAQERAAGAAKATMTALRFFSIGAFRHQVRHALATATKREVSEDDAGYLSIGTGTLPDNESASTLRTLIHSTTENRVEKVLDKLEAIAGGITLRSELRLVSNTQWVKDIAEQVQSLAPSFRIKVNNDADDDYLNELWQRLGRRDVLILNCHAGSRGGLAFKEGEGRTTAEFASLVPSLSGPAILGIAGCKSKDVGDVFLRPRGPCAFVMGRTGFTTSGSGARAMIELLGRLFDQNPIAPAADLREITKHAQKFEDRFMKMFDDKLTSSPSTSAKTMSELSPYSA